MTTSGPVAPDRSQPRSRLVGVDLARGLAVLGMFVAHAAPRGEVELWEALIRDVSAERSRLLFAVTAGLGLGLLTQARSRSALRPAQRDGDESGADGGERGEATPTQGPEPADQRPEPAGGRTPLRFEIVIRALFLLALGSLLTAMDPPVRVILDEYGVAFLVALPFLFLPGRVLLVAGTAGVLVLPGVAAALAQLPDVRAQQVEPWGIVVEWFVTGAYPVLIWWPTLLLGVALVRLGLTRRRVTLVGLAVAVVVAAVALPVGAQIVPASQVSIGIATGDVGSFALASSLTVAGNVAAMVAVALGLVALTSWLPEAPRDALVRLTSPLAAVGSMPLTVYVAQVVLLWLLTEGLGVPLGEDRWVVVLGLTGGSLLVAWLWRRAVGRGPLEQLLGAVSRPPARRRPS